MWFFDTKKKGKRTLKKEEDSTPRVTQIVEHQETQELHENDAVLRFWLPEEGKQALDEVVKCNSTTGARYMRELLVVYLYGEHELQRMRKESMGLYYTPPPVTDTETREPDSGIFFQAISKTTVDTVPELGKSIVPIKLFLPQKIKVDLQKVADVPLSTFIREILISHLFGHAFWQERLRSWSPKEESIAMEWEGDDEEKLTVNVDQSEWDKQGTKRDSEVVRL